MKFTIDKAKFLGLLSDAGKAVAKSSYGVLANILIEVEESSIRAIGTNGDVSIHTQCNLSTIDNTGEITVPASTILAMVAKLPVGIVGVQLDGSQLVITSGKAKFNVPTQSAKDYPVIPDLSDADKLPFTAADLECVLRCTVYAASKETAHALLTGVCFNRDGASLDIVSTDTGQLSLLNRPCSESGSAQVIVPASSLTVLRQLLKDCDPEDGADIAFTRAMISVKAKSWEIRSRLIDGTYVQYQKAIPSDYTTTFSLDRNDFLQAMQRAALTVSQSDKESLHRLKLAVCDCCMTVESRSDSGEFSEVLAVDQSGPDITTYINANFASAFLNSRAGSTVTLHTSEPLRPIKITTDIENEGIGVIMPINPKGGWT